MDVSSDKVPKNANSNQLTQYEPQKLCKQFDSISIEGLKNDDIVSIE